MVDVVAVELDELGIDGLDGGVETVSEVVVMADGVLLGGVVTTGVVLVVEVTVCRVPVVAVVAVVSLVLVVVAVVAVVSLVVAVIVVVGGVLVGSSAHSGMLIRLLSSVTEPFLASTRPVPLTPVVTLTEVRAMTVPAKSLNDPK